LENPKKKQKKEAGSSLFLFAYYFSITRVMRGFGVCEKNRKSKRKRILEIVRPARVALPWRAEARAATTTDNDERRERRLTTNDENDDD